MVTPRGERTLPNVLTHGNAADLAITVPGGVRLTYRQLREQVAAAADVLARIGGGRGDRVAYVFPTSAEAIVLFLAASTVGTAAPLNGAYKEDEFRFYLEDTGSRALVVPPGEAEAARRALPDGVTLLEDNIDPSGKLHLESNSRRQASRSAAAPADDDVALVLHTSGTTSRPKLVPLRHRNLFASVDNIVAPHR